MSEARRRFIQGSSLAAIGAGLAPAIPHAIRAVVVGVVDEVTVDG